MQKHTPGPWIRFTDGGETIAILPAGRPGEVAALIGVRKADACLMTAAPDLLEAAHGVDVLYTELGKALPGIVNTDAYDRVQQAVKQARAAIAKATTAT